ncbi:MAG: hypothetical protein ACYSR9_04640 [Planctomycetota bacterium]
MPIEAENPSGPGIVGDADLLHNKRNSGVKTGVSTRHVFEVPVIERLMESNPFICSRPLWFPAPWP